MSGPLARSAHMRMKMKREKGIASPRSAPVSPAASASKPSTSVAKESPKELLPAAAAVAAAATAPTAESEASERGEEGTEPEPIPQAARDERRPPPSAQRSNPDLSRRQRQQQQQPAGSPPPRARSRSRSRPRIRGGINSLETEGDYVVDVASADPSPKARSPRGVQQRRRRQQSANSDSDPFHRNRVPPTVFHFDNFPQRHNEFRAGSKISPLYSPSNPEFDPRRSFDANNNHNFPPASPPRQSSHPRSVYSIDNNPPQKYDVASMQRLQISQREQMEAVRRQNEETIENHRRRQFVSAASPREGRCRQRRQQSRRRQQFEDDSAFDPSAPGPVAAPANSGRDASPRGDGNGDGARSPPPRFRDDPSFGPEDAAPRRRPRRPRLSPGPPTVDAAPPSEPDPTEGVCSPNHKDGSRMMTIEGNDDFVYDDDRDYEERNRLRLAGKTREELHSRDGGADLEYHTNADEEYEGGDRAPDLAEDGRDFSYRTNADEYEGGDRARDLAEDGRDFGREEVGYEQTSSSQTVDSDRAQTGTPVRKKTEKTKKRRSSKKVPKFMIENVGSADSFDRSKRSDPRYAIHNNSWSQDEEDEENVRPQKSKVRGHSHKYNEIAATARRYADLDGGGRVIRGKNYEQEHGVVQLRKKQALASLEPQDSTDEEDEYSDSRKVLLPQRIGMSRSWDSGKGDEVRPLQSSKSWDAPSESGDDQHHGWRKKNTPSKKQHNIWTEEYDDNKKSPLRHHQFIGASKSWDYSHPSGADKNNNGDFSFFGSGPFGDTPTRESKKVGKSGFPNRKFDEWNEPGPDFADKHSPGSPGKMSDAPSDKPARHEDDLDRIMGTKNMPNIPTEFETNFDYAQVSDYDDEDSIFAFEKKEDEKKEEGPPPPPANPIDIFAKINNGLKQADNAKNRALRSPRAENSSSVSTAEPDVSDASEQQSKPVEKRNVAFAKEKDNTVHTYLVDESHFDSTPCSESTSGEEDDDADGEWEDIDDDVEETASPRIPDKAASPTLPADPEPKGKRMTINEGSVSPKRSRDSASLEKFSQKNQSSPRKKSVHYQSDEDTFHTNEESTMGGSFKSNRSGITNEQKGQPQQQHQERALNLLDHVDHAFTAVASSLGGLFGSPKNGNDNKVQEDKSFATDNDDNTNAQSAVPSEAPTEQSDDWFGYMERVLFPTKEESQEDFGGDRSVYTESECTNTESQYTESQYTESVNTESEGQSKFTDCYDDYADGDDEDEDDAYLLQQALAAARAVHHIHGVEYDETQEIDVLTDVKFHVVNVKLPLGLLFQEHEIGAWVSRVVPDGNGARKGVQHGDQLAAINARSAVHASIDEVAATISRTPNKQGVELTFLRYVGPLRPVPGAIIQEGFEVTDVSVNKKKSTSKPPQSPPLSPSKKNSRFFKSISPPTNPARSSSTKNIAESPNKSQSAKQLPPSSQSSPSRKTEHVTVSPESEAVMRGNNSRNNEKKKSVLGKLKSFKKKK